MEVSVTPQPFGLCLVTSARFLDIVQAALGVRLGRQEAQARVGGVYSHWAHLDSEHGTIWLHQHPCDNSVIALTLHGFEVSVFM